MGLWRKQIIIEAFPDYDSEVDVKNNAGASPSEPIPMRTKAVRGRNLSNQRKDVFFVWNLGGRMSAFICRFCLNLPTRYNQKGRSRKSLTAQTLSYSLVSLSSTHNIREFSRNAEKMYPKEKPGA